MNIMYDVKIRYATMKPMQYPNAQRFPMHAMPSLPKSMLLVLL